MKLALFGLATATALVVYGCGGGGSPPALSGSPPALSGSPTALSCANTATKAAANPVAGTTLRITTAVAQPASANMASHCLIEGAMNERIGPQDGRQYAIKFRMRLPDLWNEKLLMPGGGGSNGTLADATGPSLLAGFASGLERGYAVIVTDSGHDNALTADPARGGASAFGIDQQARIDFGYNSYDVTARLGKALASSFYGKAPKHSYFAGCSEGGREAMIMVQRFPTHFDGVIAGCPAMGTPIHQAYASLLAQTFATLVSERDTVGNPLITKAYTDGDLQLISNAILRACDALDGLEDGMVNNLAACTDAVVVPKLAAVTCAGTKNASCLSAAQIRAWRTVMAGPKTSNGTQIYPGNPWDPGIAGTAGNAVNQGFRSWWLGTYDSDSNNATKVTVSAPLHAMVHTTPPVPLTVDQNFAWELAFNRDDAIANASRTTTYYVTSAISNGLATSTDLTAFKANGGKLIQYIGQADPAVSPIATIDWWNELNSKQGGDAASFARLFLVPGMNHGRGGPSTDHFDTLTALENWVEGGIAPDSILASATTPAYFNAKSRTRPLCVYPSWAQYNGTGDINDANSFTCKR